MPSDVLHGIDGNAFNVMAVAQREMKRMGYTPKEIQQYLDEARSGDYMHLLATTTKYLDDPAYTDEEDGL